MGLVFGWVSFPGQPPTLDAVSARIAERSGLAVEAEPLGLFDGTYVLHGRLSFAKVRGVSVEVSCPEPERRWRLLAEETRLRRKMAVECGLASPEVLQAPLPPQPTGCVVDVRGPFAEPTLFYQTLLALEDLGGTPCEMGKPLPDRERRAYEEARRQYGGPVSRAELRRRLHAAERAMGITVLAHLVLLPVTIPLLAVQVLWEVLWAFPKRHRAFMERWQLGEFAAPRPRQGDVPSSVGLPPEAQEPPSQDPR